MDLEAFDREFTRCAPWIEAALVYALGTHDIEDVRETILRGDAQLWGGKRAAVVSEIQHFPRLKSLHFWLCGGDLKELTRDMRPVIEAWGITQGCSRFTTAGREGWQRVMKRHGYQPTWHICRKDLAA